MKVSKSLRSVIGKERVLTMVLERYVILQRLVPEEKEQEEEAKSERSQSI